MTNDIFLSLDGMPQDKLYRIGNDVLLLDELAQPSANSTFLQRKIRSRGKVVNTILSVCCRGILTSHIMIMIRKYHDVM